MEDASADPGPNVFQMAAEYAIDVPVMPMLGAGVMKDPENRPVPGFAKMDAYRTMRRMMTEKEENDRKRQQELASFFGLVFRVIDLRSTEARGPAKEGIAWQWTSSGPLSSDSRLLTPLRCGRRKR